jgi:hypothetical protein
MMIEGEFTSSIPDILLKERVRSVKKYQLLGQFAFIDQYLLGKERFSSLSMTLGIADTPTASIYIGKKLDQSRITTARASKESDAIPIVQEPQ